MRINKTKGDAIHRLSRVAGLSTFASRTRFGVPAVGFSRQFRAAAR
jgi:hypothetical protein